tara:strand:+ start:799 stop:1125 length:327 start_codon:yes stop_codon:yes gene_type:complete
MEKIKPEFKREKYPLQYAELTFKPFYIKQLFQGCNDNKYTKKIIFKSMPILREMYDMIFQQMDFKNRKDFLKAYIKEREKVLPPIERYHNDQDINIKDVDISGYMKNR